MPGLVPGIHVLLHRGASRERARRRRDVDARNKSGHDGRTEETSRPPARRAIRTSPERNDAGLAPAHMEDMIVHATAIVTDPVVTRHGPPTARRASATSTAATCRPADRICRPPGAARARSAFADGNADRPVESANVDIPARHPRNANVDPVAICLPDAYVDEFKPDGSGLVPGFHVLQHGGKGGNRTGRRSGGQHQQGGTGR